MRVRGDAENRDLVEETAAKLGRGESGAAYEVEELAFLAENLIDELVQTVAAGFGDGNQAILIGVDHVAGADGDAGHFDRNAGADDVVAGVARYGSAGEIVKANFADGGEVAHSAIADQADCAEASEDGRHYFSRVRGAVAVASDLLHDDHSRLRRRFHCFEQFNVRIFGSRSACGHSLDVRGDSVAAHRSHFREQAFQVERCEAFGPGAQVQQLNRVGESCGVHGFQIGDQFCVCFFILSFSTKSAASSSSPQASK